jgi:hypothetical protein
MSSAADPTPTTTEPAPAERAALERTVLALTEAEQLFGAEYDRAERRPAVGRPSDDWPSAAESWERLARTAERRVWAAQDAAQATLARDVGAYVRALRDGGMGSRQVLAAVAASVRAAAAPSIDPRALDDIAHDAGRYGVEAYYRPRDAVRQPERG